MRECGFPGWELTGLETFGILNFGGRPIPPAPAAGDADFGTFYVSNPNISCSKARESLRVRRSQRIRSGTRPMYASRHFRVNGQWRATRSRLQGQHFRSSRPGSQRSLRGSGTMLLQTSFPGAIFLNKVDDEDQVAELIYW